MSVTSKFGLDNLLSHTATSLRATAGAAAAALSLTAPLHAAVPPPAVVYAPVEVKDVSPSKSYIGHVVAIQSVQIVPRVTAFIDNIAVEQGSNVKAGQVLIELQKAQFNAAVQAAEGQLRSAQASVRQAEPAYQRAKRLHTQGFEAQSALETAQATLDQGNAAVLTAEANLQQAKLNLGYCTIRAPIAGRIGAISPTKGNLVTPSTPSLLTINQVDPIRVVFSVSDRTVVGMRQKTGQSSQQIASGLVVDLTLPDGSPYDHRGKIAFLDNQIDSQTGTLSVYADFPNPQGLLLPGSYVDVSVHNAVLQKRPLAPVASVQTDRTGSYVLVVGADEKVRQQPVTLGQQIGQDFVVTHGLSGGEHVIVAGLQKVRPGETVRASPAPQGTASSLPAGGQAENGG